MAQQVYCNNCGSMTTSKVSGSIFITLILVWFAVIPAIIYEAWRAKNKVCRECGSSSIMPLHAPAAQQAMQRQQAPIQPVYSQPQPAPQPVAVSNPKPDLPPVEVFAINKNIDGGLIEFFGLKRWYEAVFDNEQKYRLEERFGTVSGNKLASGAVKFKFSNVDALQFLYELEEKLEPKAFSDIYKLVDEQYKIEAGKFCKIDDERWNSEKYYKSWFTLMKYRIDALNKLKADNYFTKGQLDVVEDNFSTQPCLDISNKGFNVLNGDLDRAFDEHFFEPIEGCRCVVRGFRE